MIKKLTLILGGQSELCYQYISHCSSFLVPECNVALKLLEVKISSGKVSEFHI